MNIDIMVYVLVKDKKHGFYVNLNSFQKWEDLKDAIEREGNYTNEEIESKDFGYMILNGGFRSAENVSFKDFYCALKTSGVFDDEDKNEILFVYLERKCLKEWVELIQEKGENWINYVEYHKEPLETFGEKLIRKDYPDLPNSIMKCVDFRRYALNEIAKSTNMYRTKNGVLRVL